MICALNLGRAQVFTVLLPLGSNHNQDPSVQRYWPLHSVQYVLRIIFSVKLDVQVDL